MATPRAAQRRHGPSPLVKIVVGVAALAVSIAIVLAGVLVFAGELAPGGQQGSMLVMALWFLTAVAIGVAIQRRVRFLRWPLALGIVGSIVAVTGVLAATQFTDDVVDEDVVVAEPAAAAPGRGAPPADASASSESVNSQIASGPFEGLAHTTGGDATAIDLSDGGRVLTLTDFETDNGPDLRVYLVSGDVDSNGDGDDFVDLGALKGNIGDQQYDIPDSVGLAEFDSVVIWCRAFSSGFGVAELSPSFETAPS